MYESEYGTAEATGDTEGEFDSPGDGELRAKKVAVSSGERLLVDVPDTLEEQDELAELVRLLSLGIALAARDGVVLCELLDVADITSVDHVEIDLDMDALAVSDSLINIDADEVGVGDIDAVISWVRVAVRLWLCVTAWVSLDGAVGVRV